MYDANGNNIEILAGSGINVNNVEQFLEYTGINQVHSSCKRWITDPTTINDKVSFSYNDDKYDAVDYELVEMLVDIVEK